MMVLNEIILSSTYKESLESAIRYSIRLYKIVKNDCNKITFERDGIKIEMDNDVNEVSLLNKLLIAKKEKREL